MLLPFTTEVGEEYPDGFIDSCRSSLSYKDLMNMEKTLHHTEYVRELNYRYTENHPEVPLYDARLHYYMIKGIRKHRHYSDDFFEPSDDLMFFLGLGDPFPWYLYIQTFGKTESWSSHAKMRLMADNRCFQGIPIALKVLDSDKANDKIRHYAIVLAGMDQTNLRQVLSFKEKHPRAVARVLYEQGHAELYPMLLDNARNILAGINDDTLDPSLSFIPHITTGWRPPGVYKARHTYRRAGSGALGNLSAGSGKDCGGKR